MTYLWQNGLPITVITDNLGTPLSFVWNHRQHPVEGIARRWRVDEEWWRRRIWREYFKLVTETGLLVIVYQDFTSRRWYLQRLYD